MKNKVNARVFDMDGCIFNEFYYQTNSETRLIEANKELIHLISEEIYSVQYQSVVVMIGSNRQSYCIDEVNKKKHGSSCFPAIIELCGELVEKIMPIPCSVDPYLLADSYGRRPIGENFNKAVQRQLKYPFSHWLFDDTKISLIYAQIHYLASKPEYENMDIDYDFYDDRRDDILSGLAQFFRENQDLIPANVCLRLYHYQGQDITKLDIIQGAGKIDRNFQENLYLMIECAGLSFDEHYRKSNKVLHNLQMDQRLEKFKSLRDVVPPRMIPLTVFSQSQNKQTLFQPTMRIANWQNFSQGEVGEYTNRFDDKSFL